MEAFFPIILAALVFWWFHALRKRRGQVRRYGRHFKSGRGTRPASFDAGSAQAEVPRRHLNGPAYVVDGDTIVIRNTQIRLFGVDAPELNHPYGQNAKWAMFNLCRGQAVLAEILATDVHGRTVARCYLPDGRDLSAEIVKQELALDWPKYSGGIYRHLEPPNARRKLWLADARQRGRMDIWERFEAQQKASKSGQ